MSSLQELEEAFEVLDAVAQDVNCCLDDSIDTQSFEENFQAVYKLCVETYHAIGEKDHPLKRVLERMKCMWISYQSDESEASRKQFFMFYYRFAVFRYHVLDPTHEPCFRCRE